jgi:hypothetical protein
MLTEQEGFLVLTEFTILSFFSNFRIIFMQKREEEDERYVKYITLYVEEDFDVRQFTVNRFT